MPKGGRNGLAKTFNRPGADALDRQAPLSVEMGDLPIERFDFVSAFLNDAGPSSTLAQGWPFVR